MQQYDIPTDSFAYQHGSWPLLGQQESLIAAIGGDHDALQTAFCWAETPQDFHYWSSRRYMRDAITTDDIDFMMQLYLARETAMANVPEPKFVLSEDDRLRLRCVLACHSLFNTTRETEYLVAAAHALESINRRTDGALASFINAGRSEEYFDSEVLDLKERTSMYPFTVDSLNELLEDAND